MAAVKLGSKAEGSIVKIKENGVPVEFYVFGLNYESGLNGPGRVGIIRKDGYDKRPWNIANTDIYAGSTIDAWLNGDYKAMLDPNIQAAMGTTRFYCMVGGGNKTVTTLDRAVFLLSITEFGLGSTSIPAEGTVLSSTVLSLLRIVYLDGKAESQLTRTSNNYGNQIYVVGYTGRPGLGSPITNLYCCRPAFTLPADLYVSDDGTVLTNTAPSTPAGINVPSDISGGTVITVSWEPSTDAEGNLYGYKVEKSADGGTTWEQIYQGPAVSTTDAVAFGTATVMYRVKAYDTEGLESSWCTSGQVTVVNNRAPTAPASITVPLTVIGGADLVISWGAATDSDDNLAGYELERQVDSRAWERLCRENVRAYTDTITKGWETVAYRVRAYDDLDVAGPYTTSQTRKVNNNTAPVITCATPSGSDLGVKAEDFTVDYSVDDVDADAVTVTEAIDGVAKRAFQAVLGQSNTFEITGDTFMRVLNGKHTLTITANDGQASTIHTLTFTKEVTAASITLETPLDADAEITLAVLSVVGSIPADATYKVEVTNNGKDAQPVWQDATAAVKSGANVVFENHTAESGFAFNFRVTVERGESGQGGYITSVQGGFQ